MNPMYVLALMSLALVGSAAADTKQLLEALCRRADDAPQVTTIGQVNAMATLIENDASVKCSVEVEAIVKRLAEVVALPNVCSSEAADVLVKFWKDFGSSKAPKHRHLPHQLKRFFLGFGLQTSKLCKQTLMRELEKATKDKGISEEDIKIVARPAMAKVGKIFSDVRIDNLMAIVQASREDKIPSKPVKMNSLRMEFYSMQRERCDKKFKPIYDTLISPIVRLAAIGISYNSNVKTQMKEFEKEELYNIWFAAVLACEATALIYPVKIAKVKVDADGNEEMLTMLDEEDIEQLEKMTGMKYDAPEAVPIVEYAIEPVQVGDLVLDFSDEYLFKRIDKHSRTLGTVTQFKMRMLRKMPSIAKTLMLDKAMKVGLLPRAGKKNRNKVAHNKFGSSRDLFWGFMTLLCGAGLIGGTIIGAIVLFGVTHGSIASLVILMGILISATILAFTISIARTAFSSQP